jgi:hypothetical protein
MARRFLQRFETGRIMSATITEKRRAICAALRSARCRRGC